MNKNRIKDRVQVEMLWSISMIIVFTSDVLNIHFLPLTSERIITFGFIAISILNKFYWHTAGQLDCLDDIRTIFRD